MRSWVLDTTVGAKRPQRQVAAIFRFAGDNLIETTSSAKCDILGVPYGMFEAFPGAREKEPYQALLSTKVIDFTWTSRIHIPTSPRARIDIIGNNTNAHRLSFLRFSVRSFPETSFFDDMGTPPTPPPPPPETLLLARLR